MSELISVVTPVYNAEKFIENTINCVLNQTYDNIEMILCENGSTDNTKEILQGINDPRVKVIFLEDNAGAAEARNMGVREAKGDYIAYIDADDVWMPDKLEKQIAFMKEKDAAFCFTGYEFANEDAKPLGKIVSVPETITYKQALRNTTIFTSTVCFDMRKLSKDRIMMPCIKSEDTALWWRLLREGVSAYGLNENMVLYRRPATSLSSNKVEAVRRIWNLYRKSEKLNIFVSAICFVGWGFRAVKRRV